MAHGWSAHFQEFTPLFHFKVPAILHTAPINYCVSVGANCPHTGFVATGSYFDLPAVLITFVLTIILVKGIKESASFNAFMVAIKLVIVLMVIGIGVFFINKANWTPFAPYGYTGVSFFRMMNCKGGEPAGCLRARRLSSSLHRLRLSFSSLGEAKNPSSDVPKGIIWSLVICTILYTLRLLPCSREWSYNEIALMLRSSMRSSAGLIGAVSGGGGCMTGIFGAAGHALSQPRVMLALGRDGLVPNSFFGDIHPKWRTPWKSTILTGFFVAAMAGFIPLSILAEMTSIGTLFAFVIVCGAVLVMRKTNPNANRPFRAPLVPLVPILGIATCLLLMFSLPAENWYRLIIWLAVGLVIYFLYGRRHSVMAMHTAHEIRSHGISPAGQAVADPDAPPSSPSGDVDPRIK